MIAGRIDKNVFVNRSFDAGLFMNALLQLRDIPYKANKTD